MGAFQGMSLLARWAIEQLAADEIPPSVKRAFMAVEHVYSDRAFKLGGELGVEFLEAISEDPEARACAFECMGPAGRRWLRSFSSEVEDP